MMLLHRLCRLVDAEVKLLRRKHSANNYIEMNEPPSWKVRGNDLWPLVKMCHDDSSFVQHVVSPSLRTLLWSAWKDHTAQGSAETSASTRTRCSKEKKKNPIRDAEMKGRTQCRLETTASAANKCGDVETPGNLNENLPNLLGRRHLPKGRQCKRWKFLLMLCVTFLTSLCSKELTYLFPFLSLENKYMK